MTAALPPTSRYAAVQVALYVSSDGRVTAYLRRRLLPPPERLGLLVQHTVTSSDRLDRIAAGYLGDPQLFWRIADGNRELRPEDLTAVLGRQLRITAPDGMPGMPNV